MSVTSAAVSTGLAAFGAGCNASGDPPAYTPSVHTLFFAADGRLSCTAESLTLTAIEAAIVAERVKTADTPRARLISDLLCHIMWVLRCSDQVTSLHHTAGSPEPQPKVFAAGGGRRVGTGRRMR